MLKEVKHARKNLKDVIKRVELLYAEKLSKIVEGDVLLKLENLQKSGSFKIRGAFNKISSLSKEELARGVVCCSAGNHAQGVAVAATKLGAKSYIVMPDSAPLAKIQATREFGGEVILAKGTFDDAMVVARKLEKEKNLVFVHPFDDEKIMEGTGTIGLEIFEECKDVDQVIVPVGGGGLIAGVASILKELNPNIKIYGVQTYKTHPVVSSMKLGKHSSVKASPTIADGIAVGTPGFKTFELIQKHVDEVVTVSEDEIAETILFLMEKCKQVVEGAGAVSVASILNNKIDAKGKKTVCIISGGNIDVTALERIINRALISLGRRIELKVSIDDRPGSMASLLEIISHKNASIISLKTGYSRKNLPVGKQAVTVLIDTAGRHVTEELIFKLKEKGYNID